MITSRSFFLFFVESGNRTECFQIFLKRIEGNEGEGEEEEEEEEEERERKRKRKRRREEATYVSCKVNRDTSQWMLLKCCTLAFRASALCTER